MDNDGDGLADNADPQCGIDRALEEDCAMPGTCPNTCFDGIDNAGADGADGMDASGDCAGIPVENGATIGGVPDLGSCYDGIDNSADGADLADPDCLVAGATSEDGAGPGTCNDGMDNGADNLIDGADPSCPNIPTENGGPADSCTDGIDNSADGFDMGDADCLVAGATSEDGAGPGTCNDGRDNGADGLIDWQDPNCAGFPTEDITGGYGSCWDGRDNDADGVDGFDPDCTYGGGWGGLKGFIDYNGDPGTWMHEFGHTLGLMHGGPFAVAGVPVPGNPHPNSINCKPPYISVMSYDHQFGIRQDWNRGGSEDGAGPGTCNDSGIDNGPDGLADQNDPDCQNGTDIGGNGVLRILDFAPPRFNDVDGDGVADGRGADLTAFTLNEAQLNEGVVMDSTDPWNLAMLIDGFGNKVPVPMNGFNFMLNEATRAVAPGGAPGDCADGIDNNGDNQADTEDPNCYGYDYDSDGIIDPTTLIASNIDTSGTNGFPAACTNNVTRTPNGPNDWLNLGLPAPGPGFEPPPTYAPEPVYDVAEETVRHLEADLQLRFGAPSYIAKVGVPTPIAVQVVNRGPNLARGVWVVFEATGGVELLPGATSCITENAMLYCEVGDRARGGFADLEIEVKATLPPPGVIRRVTARVESYETYDLVPLNNAASVPLYATPSFASFDDPGQWDASVPTTSSDNRTEGDASLEVGGCNYATLRSPSFNTTEWEVVGSEFQLDVFIPAAVPNPYYVGDLQLFFDSFPAGAYTVPVGQVLLTNLPRGQWSTVSFPLPEDVALILQDDVARSQLTLAVNTSLCGPEHLLLDNLRFGGDVSSRGGPHQPTSGQPTVSESIFTFDNLTDWSSSSSLSLEPELVVQGAAALLVGTTGYSQVTSRGFATTELSVVTDRLSLDVRLNGPPPNPYWVGDVQLFFSCPSASLWNQYLGRADLFSVFFDEYNAVAFDVPANVKQVLQGNYSGCSFTIALTGTPAPEGFYLDNMGFVE